MRIAAAIITFNPERERLLENLASVQPQVDKVLIVDNGSENWQEFDHLAGVKYIKSPENKGIAWALNRAFEWAHENSFDWLLTLDQDSVVESSFVAKLVGHNSKSEGKIGLIYPRIFDPNTDAAISRENPFIMKLRFLKRKMLKWVRYLPITSGSLVNVKAFLLCGGVDEEYFIENVDHYLDLKLLHCGFSLIPALDSVLEQRFGTPRQTQNANRGGIYISGHTAWRYYYVYRNRVWLHRYFLVAPSCFVFDDIFFLLKIPVYRLFGERQIPKAMVSGIWDAICRRKKTHGEIVTQFSLSE